LSKGETGEAAFFHMRSRTDESHASHCDEKATAALGLAPDPRVQTAHNGLWKCDNNLSNGK